MTEVLDHYTVGGSNNDGRQSVWERGVEIGFERPQRLAEGETDSAKGAGAPAPPDATYPR